MRKSCKNVPAGAPVEYHFNLSAQGGGREGLGQFVPQPRRLRQSASVRSHCSGRENIDTRQSVSAKRARVQFVFLPGSGAFVCDTV